MMRQPRCPSSCAACVRCFGSHGVSGAGGHYGRKKIRAAVDFERAGAPRRGAPVVPAPRAASGARTDGGALPFSGRAVATGPVASAEPMIAAVGLECHAALFALDAAGSARARRKVIDFMTHSRLEI